MGLYLISFQSYNVPSFRALIDIGCQKVQKNNKFRGCVTSPTFQIELRYERDQKFFKH